jgi:hypothetical protein
MRRRSRRDPLKSQIAEQGKIPLRLYKQLDRDIRFPFDAVGWWTLVGLKSSAAGAAVMLGSYRRAVADGAREQDEPIEWFAQAADDLRAMRRAYRVIARAYMCELTAEVWPERYDHEMDEAVAAVLTVSRYERQLRAEGRVLASPADPVAAVTAFRRKVFAAMLAAATGSDAWETSGGPAAEAWLRSYVAGRSIAAVRVKELSYAERAPLVMP